MDLSVVNAALKDSFEVEIYHPVTGDGGWFIKLAAPHHAAAQAKVNAIIDRSKKRKVTSVAQDERDGVDLLLARVLDWRGLKNGEEEVVFSEEVGRKVFSDPKSYWIRQQLIEALGDTTRPFTN